MKILKFFTLNVSIHQDIIFKRKSQAIYKLAHISLKRTYDLECVNYPYKLMRKI